MEQGNYDWPELNVAVQRFVRNRVHDRHAAEDLVQDVLTKAIATATTRGMDPGYARAWALTVARHAVTDYYRLHRRARPRSLEQEPVAPPAPDPAADSARRASQCLPHLVKRLPKRYRDALELSDLHGLPQRATADRLELTVAGVKSRVRRARAQLRTMLEDCCRIEFDGRRGVHAMEATDRSMGYCGQLVSSRKSDGFCIPSDPRPFKCS